MKKQLKYLILVLLFSCSLASPSYGANCALRNPDREIFDMFPNATRYRSEVGKVDVRIRDRVEDELGFKLAFSDLGKHSLYLVYSDDMLVPHPIIIFAFTNSIHSFLMRVWHQDIK